MTHAEATFYAQVAPVRATYNPDRVVSAKVIRLTQNMPEYPHGGCAVVKLTVRVPVSAFGPLVPEPVTVEADPEAAMVVAGELA